MSKLIALNIDVKKLDKSRFFESEKTGAVYCSLDVWIYEDEEVDYKQVSVNQSQTKEEREAKQKKNYCGGGKLIYGWEKSPTPKLTSNSYRKETGSDDILDDDVPF